MERATYGGLQHSRKYNIEVDGFPAAVEDDALRPAATALLKVIQVDMDEDD